MEQAPIAQADDEPQFRQATMMFAQPTKTKLPPSVVKSTEQQQTAPQPMPPRNQGRLVGRREELARLVGCYKQILKDERAHKIVMVTGASGSGKTALVQQLKDLALRDQGIYRTGKFDLLGLATPCQAMSQGCADAAYEMAQAGPEALGGLKRAFEAAMAESKNHGVLTQTIHELDALLGNDKDAVKNDAKVVLKQQVSRTGVYGIVLKAIASLGRPIVIVGENEHWADKDTVERLSFLYESSDFKNCLHIVTSLEPIPQLYQNHREKILHIHLSNLSLDDTRELVNDMGLAVDGKVAELVFELTQGNPAFIHQSVYLLQEHSVLQDVTGASRCLEDCTVVEDVVRRRFETLNDKVQYVLRYAALFGTPIDITLLSRIISSTSVESALGIGKERHFLAESGPRRVLVFANDCVQRAIIDTMEKPEQAQIHCSIGKKLLKALSEEEIHDRVFQVMDQLRRGEECITSDSERKTIAALCLTASKRAVESSSFFVALTYLQFGIRLVEHDSSRAAWRDDYDLNLTLHNACCELMYCLGDLNEAEKIQETLLQHGRTFDDKVQAKMMKVYTLSARGLMADSVREGLDALKQLGVSLPAQPSKAQLLLDLVKTKRALKNKSDEAILRLPVMVEERKSAIMKLFVMTLTSAYYLDSLLAAHLIIRAMLFTIKNGICAASSVAFAAYALFLGNTIKYTDEGIRFGNLALRFLQEHNCIAYATRVYGMVHAHVFPWRESYGELVEPLRFGYRNGLETGDVEYAATCMAMCIFHQWQTDVPLTSLDVQLHSCIALMRSRSQNALMSIMLPFQRLVRNLMDCYDSMSVDDLNSHFGQAEGYKSLSHWQHHNSAIPAYVYGDYRVAEAESSSARKTPASSLIGPDECFIFMMHALVQIAMVAGSHVSRSKRRRLSAARKDLKLIRKVAKRCPVNVLSRLLLVEADYLATTCNDQQRIETAFIQAAGVANEANFIMGSAFCHERWGRYLLRRGDDVGAKTHLRKSVEFFRTWGAEGKVNHLSREFKKLLTSSEP